ncbi:hypothetical protein WG66_007350 [Moniliophthora roreri]|nr:hypothetical protein WG66_007350 [Moniliophthora roreri]
MGHVFTGTCITPISVLSSCCDEVPPTFEGVYQPKTQEYDIFTMESASMILNGVTALRRLTGDDDEYAGEGIRLQCGS